MASAKNIPTWKPGDKFKIKPGAAHGTTYLNNTVYTVINVNGNQVCGNAPDGTSPGTWLHIHFIARPNLLLAELQKSEAEALERLDEARAKIKFVTDNDLTEYDEQEFMIYQALTIIEQTDGKLEKTRKLAALVRELV